jgi:Flp pilus assembly protein protease CpaA
MDLLPKPGLMIAAIVITGVAAASDWRRGIIPNRLVLVGAIGVLGARCFAEAHASLSERALSILVGLAGAVLASLAPLLMYRAGGMGGGDVKLLALLGLALGPLLGLETEFYAFLLVVLFAPAYLAYQGRLWQAVLRSARFASHALRRRPLESLETSGAVAFRFGPAVFSAAVLCAALRLWPAFLGGMP